MDHKFTAQKHSSSNTLRFCEYLVSSHGRKYLVSLIVSPNDFCKVQKLHKKSETMT
jgi:hypothetical protein